MSRFATLTKEDIDELLAKKYSERTHRANDSASKLLARYCVEKNIILDLKTVDCNTLDGILSQFYAEARKDSGELYKKTACRHYDTVYIEQLKPFETMSTLWTRKNIFKDQMRCLPHNWFI